MSKILISDDTLTVATFGPFPQLGLTRTSPVTQNQRWQIVPARSYRAGSTRHDKRGGHDKCWLKYGSLGYRAGLERHDKIGAASAQLNSTIIH